MDLKYNQKDQNKNLSKEDNYIIDIWKKDNITKNDKKILQKYLLLEILV